MNILQQLKMDQNQRNTRLLGLEKLLQGKTEIVTKILKASNYFEQKQNETYKSRIESIRWKLKRTYYLKQIVQFKTRYEKIWTIMKETIGMTHYQNAKNKSKRLRKPIKKFKTE